MRELLYKKTVQDISPGSSVLFIQSLNPLTYWLARLFSKKFDAVYFIDMYEGYRSEECLAKLEQEGMRWLNYKDFPGPVFLEIRRERTEFCHNFAEEQLRKTRIFQWLKNDYFHHQTDAIEKYECNIKDFLSRLFNHSCETLYFIRLFVEQTGAKVTFFPMDHLYQFYSDPLGKNGFVVPPFFRWCLFLSPAFSTAQFLLKKGRRLIAKLSSLFVQKWSMFCKKGIRFRAVRRDSEPRTIDPKECEIGYFPHKEIHYAGFWTKNFIYSSSKESPFYHKKILHFFLGDTDKLSVRYLHFYKIPIFIFRKRAPLQSAFKYGLKYFLRPMTHLSMDLFSGLSPFIVGALCRELTVIVFFESWFDEFPKLKFVIAYYDLIFPKSISAILCRRGIRTISIQERGYSCLYYVGFMNFDYYLTWGEVEEKILWEKSRSKIKRCIPVGLQRSDLLKHYRENPWNFPKYLEIKKHASFIIAYDYHTAADRIEGGIRPRAQFKKTREFYEALIQLAIRNPDFYISIKGKETGSYALKEYKKIVEEINHLPNIDIIYDLKKYNTYRLTPYADCVICQHTSIGEEALSVGIPVIFFDNDYFLKMIDHVYYRFGLAAENADELEKKVGSILSGKEWLTQDQRDFLDKEIFHFSNCQSAKENILHALHSIYSTESDSGGRDD